MLDYNLNKEYIAATLCENRAKPLSVCKGKCQLEKKLAEEEKQHPTSNTLKSTEDILFINEWNIANFTGLMPHIDKMDIYQPLLSQTTSDSIFHPPCS